MENIFEIRNCEEFGDYIVASRDFQECELIFEEEPLSLAPAENKEMLETDFSCVGCCRILPEVSIRCDVCGWPVCSQVCSKNTFHCEFECPLFAEKKILPKPEYVGHLKFVRFAQLKNLNPEKYSKLISLSANFGDRLESFQELINRRSNEIWTFLTSVCKFAITLNEVIHLWRVFRINGFSVKWLEEPTSIAFRGTAVLEKASKLSHSCANNAEWVFVKVIEGSMMTWKFQLLTKAKIKKGELITISYSCEGFMFGTGYRRDIFQEGSTFACLCSRCTDPTEGGTFFSSPKCPKCKRGNMLADDPLASLTCRWSCSRSKCSFIQDGEEINEEVKSAEVYARKLTERTSLLSLDQLDAFIDANSGTTLNKNHFILYQSSLSWLGEQDFSEALMQQSTESTILLQKILDRTSRCIRLSRMFVETISLVPLELMAADALAAVGFKIPNCRTVPSDLGNLRNNLRVSKMILRHLSEACKWMEIQPNFEYFELGKQNLNALYCGWKNYYDLVSEKLSTADGLEDFGLLNIASLFE